MRSDGAWENKGHFCAVASMAMRQILSNHARDKRAAKRSGNVVDVTLSGLAGSAGDSEFDLVALDEALRKLEGLNPRHARMVELRFFGGLTIEEVARQLEVSPRTVKNDWRAVRAWLGVELGGRASETEA